MEAAQIDNLSTRIKSNRIRLNLSQDDLAKRIGVSRPSVTQWESGDTKNIKNDNLVALARAFKISVDELLTGKPLVAHHIKPMHSVSESEELYNNVVIVREEDIRNPEKLESSIKFVEEMLGELSESVSAATKSKLIMATMSLIDDEGNVDVRAASQLIIKEVGKKNEAGSTPSP